MYTLQLDDKTIFNVSVEQLNKLVESGEITQQQADDAVADYEQKEAKSLAKSRKKQQIKELTVEIDNLVFDANENSQQRMLSAITASETAGQTETIWKMADNTTQTVTLEQLKQAQALAIQATGAILLS